MDQLDIPTLVQHQFYLRFADIAALSVLVYDYLLTFDLEVTYVWGSRWTFVKVLYLVVRTNGRRLSVDHKGLCHYDYI